VTARLDRREESRHGGVAGEAGVRAEAGADVAVAGHDDVGDDDDRQARARLALSNSRTRAASSIAPHSAPRRDVASMGARAQPIELAARVREFESAQARPRLPIVIVADVVVTATATSAPASAPTPASPATPPCGTLHGDRGRPSPR